MTTNGLLQIALFFGLLLLTVEPLGGYMARVYEGERVWLDRVLGPLERLLYRLAGVTPSAEQTWKGYAGALLLFSAFAVVPTKVFTRRFCFSALNSSCRVRDWRGAELPRPFPAPPHKNCS